MGPTVGIPDAFGDTPPNVGGASNKMLHIHCVFRMHGNVYINISTTIRNCSNNHYTTKIAWENATREVVTRLQEQGTRTKAHNKHTAVKKDYLLSP